MHLTDFRWARRALKAEQQTESRQRRAFEIDLELDEVRRPRRFSRKEVIQPHLPIRLPCYDFTPITDHTLGASLPCGLVWRLLVQPAFVM